MTKALYVGVGSKARRVKNAYIGVNSKARKVTKMYVGVSGKARLFWSSEKKLSKYNNASDLSIARYFIGGASIGEYALFGGGYYYQSYNYHQTSVIEAYNTSLVRSLPTALSVSRSQAATATIGNYALFAGGGTGMYATNVTAVVDAYNNSLTRSNGSNLTVARKFFTGTTVGNYALFGGGGASSVYATVDAYNTSLTRTTPKTLSIARKNLTAVNASNYALFCGGAGRYSGPTYATVDAYNASLTLTTTTALSIDREYLASTKIGDYALVGGGRYYENTYEDEDTGEDYDVYVDVANVDVYNKALTRSTISPLTVGRHGLAAVTLDRFAIFTGGYFDGYNDDWEWVSDIKNTSDAYDQTLTKCNITNLTSARYWHSTAITGNYALFAGGVGVSSSLASVEVYVAS